MAAEAAAVCGEFGPDLISIAVPPAPAQIAHARMVALIIGSSPFEGAPAREIASNSDVRQCALTEVLALGSFSAAARKLNLTQPAVSLQIRELESRLGVRLIERFGKQAHATAPGRDLAHHSERIFAECDAAEQSMKRYHEGWMGRVHIGTTLTALLYELPPILSAGGAAHTRASTSW
jgi:hypothetical protein